MRRKASIILALVLVFALMFTACTARRPLQNPVQPRSDTTGLYNNNRGAGSGTGGVPGSGIAGTGTTTGTGTKTGYGTYSGMGPSSNDPYDLGYGAGNNAGYSGYGATGAGRNYGGTGAAGNYGGAGATGTYGAGGGTGNYGGAYGNNGVGTGYYGGGVTGMGSPIYYGGYGGYGGYNNGMYGGYGNDYRNVGGSNNSPNYGYNNGANTTQAEGIERSVEQMTGVDNAAVVVTGTTAYVGIDTDGDLTGRNISYGNATDLPALKRAVAQRVRTANPQIQTVYVSTDANFFERIRRVGDGVRNGNPVNGFTNELSNLIRGITPEKQ